MDDGADAAPRPRPPAGEGTRPGSLGPEQRAHPSPPARAGDRDLAALLLVFVIVIATSGGSPHRRLTPAVRPGCSARSGRSPAPAPARLSPTTSRPRRTRSTGPELHAVRPGRRQPAPRGRAHVRRRPRARTRRRCSTCSSATTLRATFFEVGVLERYFHSSTSRIVQDGFPIGDHTFYHLPMSRSAGPSRPAELLQQARTIARYGAPFPRLFRPPYGVWNATTLSLLAKYHMLMVMWTVDTDDYQQPGVSAIVESAVRGARPGAIILLHDAGGTRSETVAALPIIIRDLRARGYRLVTVPRLLLDNPPPEPDQNIAGLTGWGAGKSASPSAARRRRGSSSAPARARSARRRGRAGRRRRRWCPRRSRRRARPP